MYDLSKDDSLCSTTKMFPGYERCPPADTYLLRARLAILADSHPRLAGFGDAFSFLTRNSSEGTSQ